MSKLVLIPIHLEVDPEKKVRQLPNQELASAMDPEVVAFQQWFCKQGNDALTGLERSILRTYLAWKLLYETQTDPGSGS